MPGLGIVGLTDQLAAGYPEIGKLHKGGPKGSGTGGFGADLSHFRFVSDSPNIQAAFHSIYGAKPDSLTAMLPYTTAMMNFDVCKERWGKSGLLHRCDGQTMQVWRGQDGCMHTNPMPCAGGCTAIGRLNLILPDLLKAIRLVGIVTLETHSKNDIVRITRTLLQVEQQARGMGLTGGVMGVPLLVRRSAEVISVPSSTLTGVRRTEQHWLVEVTPILGWVSQGFQGDVPQLDAEITPQLPPSIAALEGEIIEAEPPLISPKPAPLAWIERYRQLAERAKALELDYLEIGDGISEADLTALGRELSERVQAAEQLVF